MTFHERSNEIPVAARADQGSRVAGRQETSKDRREQKKAVMPDGEDERVLFACPHDFTAILQFKAQSAHPELD